MYLVLNEIANIRQMIFSTAFFNENIWNLIQISLNCVPKDSTGNKSALVQLMAWFQTGTELNDLDLISIYIYACVCVCVLQASMSSTVANACEHNRKSSRW